MFTNPFTRGEDPHRLAVSMTGVQRGDRIIQIGVPDVGRLIAVARTVGLSGRAVAVLPDDPTASHVQRLTDREDVVVEIHVAWPTRLPAAEDCFDLAVVDDASGLLGSMSAEDRVAAVREVRRVLRPGGRVVLVGTIPRGGIGAVFTRAQSGPSLVASGVAGALFESDGFRAVRTLAERDHLIFVEGRKPTPTA